MRTTNPTRIAAVAGAAVVLLATATFAIATGTQTARAESDQSGKSAYPNNLYQCSLTKIAGEYGFLETGTILANNPFGLPAGPYEASGILNLDPTGDWHTAHMTVSINGTVSQTNQSGTWNVSPDCAITAALAPGSPPQTAQTAAGMVASGGQEMDLISTAQGLAFTIVGKRINPHP